MPKLPEDDVNVIIRPRSGLNPRAICGASLEEAIRRAANIGKDELVTICPNYTQNIVVVSAPEENTATKLAKIRTIKIGMAEYEVGAYVSAPEQGHHQEYSTGLHTGAAYPRTCDYKEPFPCFCQETRKHDNGNTAIRGLQGSHVGLLQQCHGESVPLPQASGFLQGMRQTWTSLRCMSETGGQAMPNMWHEESRDGT
ncbi:hypothetical protein HPB50_020110 [Hyalomma asiaticum]|uniref:Uncharacterized protein n=1 Tax=Hyalomma asiaticum TaxID=266040 RepID=A0ACB7S1P6_HYAAI|nr:hypothetical protein HPB50_020110 [Hyalomma asiaticum]